MVRFTTRPMCSVWRPRRVLLQKQGRGSADETERRKLSSAAVAARMRLIERVLDNATEDYLGMDASKKPPEMSMYLSALRHKLKEATNMLDFYSSFP